MIIDVKHITDNDTNITVACDRCCKIETATITYEDYRKHISKDKDIDMFLTYIPVKVRNMLKTGFCSKCYKKYN